MCAAYYSYFFFCHSHLGKPLKKLWLKYSNPLIFIVIICTIRESVLRHTTGNRSSNIWLTNNFIPIDINSVWSGLWSGTPLSEWLTAVWTVPAETDEPNWRVPELTSKSSWTESQLWEESFDTCTDCAVHMHGAQWAWYSRQLDHNSSQKIIHSHILPIQTFHIWPHLKEATPVVKQGMLHVRTTVLE